MRVVLADDAVVLREGLARMLEQSGVGVAGQAGTPDELLRLVDEHRPDVAIVDIRMPPTMTDEGLTVAERIAESFPDVAVLVLSQYVEASYALRLIEERRGGVGYLLKDRVLEIADFVTALQRLTAGETVVDAALIAQLVQRRRTLDPLDELTTREREVLALMAEGLTDRGISARLYITPKTTETHIRHIFSKLSIPSTPNDNRRVHAVLGFLRAETPPSREVRRIEP